VPGRFRSKRIEKTSGFPEHFSNCLLFWDWQRPFMKRGNAKRGRALVGIEAFTAAVTLENAKPR
jgi:hypothetical protein